MFASGKCFTLINPNLLVYPINLLLWIGQESSGVSTVHLRVVELERNGQLVAEENLRSSSAVLGRKFLVIRGFVKLKNGRNSG